MHPIRLLVGRIAFVVAGVASAALVVVAARSMLARSRGHRGATVGWFVAVVVLSVEVILIETTLDPVRSIAIPLTAIAVVLFAIRMREPLAVPLGLLIAGMMGLLLAGLSWGRWRPLTALGAGPADVGAVFVLVGWTWLVLGSVVVSSRIRGTIASALHAAGNRVSPERTG